MPKTKNKMSDFDACAVIEGFDGQEHTREDVIAAFQALIDSGTVWHLQGFYGRRARALIEHGVCHD
jgi:hypothetical protein